MDRSRRITLHETLTGYGLDERRIRQFLSPMTATICDLVGLETGLAIIDHLGGRQVALTKHPTKKAQLVRVAGEDNARKITEFFGADQHIVIPNPFTARTLLRLEGMNKLAGGASYSDVAHALRVSRSTVRTWTEKLPSPRGGAE